MSRHPLKGLRVHVEGMGLTGSLLAYQLERLGAEWTWHDVNAPVTAWKASTGAIYPAGKPGSLDDECYRVWDRWLGAMPLESREDGAAELPVERPYPTKFFEQAAYWFRSQQPPHGGRYPFHGPTKHGLRNAGPVSYHLNSQRFVPHTRSKFGERMATVSPRRTQVYVVAHGFGARLQRVLWGWAVPVQLRYDRHVYGTGGCRPCYYFREGRFVMAYAYPIPGTEWWYAGSSLIAQKQPAQLEIQPKYERWRKTFERLSGGAAKVIDRGAELEGWRPSEGGAHVDPRVSRHTRRFASGGQVPELRVPPLWHSGIRHFPRVWQQLQAELVKLGAER